jgi:hypothetical protein
VARVAVASAVESILRRNNGFDIVFSTCRVFLVGAVQSKFLARSPPPAVAAQQQQETRRQQVPAVWALWCVHAQPSDSSSVESNISEEGTQGGMRERERVDSEIGSSFPTLNDPLPADSTTTNPPAHLHDQNISMYDARPTSRLPD